MPIHWYNLTDVIKFPPEMQELLNTLESLFPIQEDMSVQLWFTAAYRERFLKLDELDTLMFFQRGYGLSHFDNIQRSPND